MDTLSKSKRSEIMRCVQRSNTNPEILVRKAAHQAGLRFRLHRKELPGSPDLVFPKWKVCLFVHGCFWHRHDRCKKTTMPKSNVQYWKTKFTENVARDNRVTEQLRSMGWKVVTVWECETQNLVSLSNRIEALVKSPKP